MVVCCSITFVDAHVGMKYTACAKESGPSSLTVPWSLRQGEWGCACSDLLVPSLPLGKKILWNKYKEHDLLILKMCQNVNILYCAAENSIFRNSLKMYRQKNVWDKQWTWLKLLAIITGFYPFNFQKRMVLRKVLDITWGYDGFYF